MHPSKTYRTTPERENLLFAEQRGFGVWVINGTADDDNMPVIATAPFYLDKTSHESGHVLPTVKAHLMKDNTLGMFVYRKIRTDCLASQIALYLYVCSPETAP